MAAKINMTAMTAMKTALNELLQKYGLDTIKHDLHYLLNNVENASAIGEEAKSFDISKNRTLTV